MENFCLNMLKASVWLPDGYEDAAYIAKETGVPLEVVCDKMGIVRKCRASKDEHPSMMAVAAARMALKNIDPLSIDLVIWTGSEYKDYMVWSAGIYVQRELGLKNAYAFDVAARCSSNVLGLKVAKNFALGDKKIKRILLCGGHKTGDLVNYKDKNARFLNNLSDGGSAVLLEASHAGEQYNPILESKFITDGDFSLDVIIPGGGTRRSHIHNQTPENFYLTVPDVLGMRERLSQKSIENFLKVIKEAAQNTPIDYLALLHMKRSAHDEILEKLRLSQNQSIYLDHYGHFGAPDQILSLGLAEKKGLVKKGDHIVLASAGIGYTWSAVALKYDGPIFDLDTLKTFE